MTVDKDEKLFWDQANFVLDDKMVGALETVAQ